MIDDKISAVDVIAKRLWQWTAVAMPQLSSYDMGRVEDGWEALHPLTGFKLRALHCRALELRRTMGGCADHALVEIATLVDSITIKAPKRMANDIPPRPSRPIITNPPALSYKAPARR